MPGDATEGGSWLRAVGCVVKVSARGSERRVTGLIPDSTNFLANSSGQATTVSLFTKQ